ncbi:DUF937 domain-containing protein [Arthrobacter sp. FW305-BF8]|uniref:DUF937 domain-containing protein n=1 Tax=Arthrobacter sp. FW305-BF8 TaxID=2879617 RepID=UPI001F255241|nr:DUF937 domain-containing protein [Arthrobacter sp. FW305-BF8]UKA55872.1 DUF937 domain-containing protein [Arthrobacter sp. FW305-BF8]
MSDIQELLGQIPVQQIATLLGTDTASAQAAVEAAVPTLLAGMQNNVQAPDGAAALESELARHRNGLADGGVDPSQVDTQDGEKIVGHVFGGQQDQVASQLAGTANLGGVGGDLVRKLLPILAPIVMSYLAKKVLGGGQGSGAQPSPAGGGGIDLGSILGGILGGSLGGLGSGGQGTGGQGSGGLGDILGGILGGGSQPQQAPLTEQDQEPPAQSGRAQTNGSGQLNDSGPANDSAAPSHRSVTPGELIEVDLPDENR